MKINRAERGDLARILAIQKEAFREEAVRYGDFSLPPLLETYEEIASEFESKVFLKAELEGFLVGAVRAQVTGATCLIGRLVVDPRFQSRGIGSALLLQVESVFPEVERFELFTGDQSEGNIRLYERHGYVGFRKEVLSAQATLIYMQKMRALPESAGSGC